VNNKNRKTLAAVSERPERGDIRWEELASLLHALGCRQLQGGGSRVRFVSPEGLILRLHRPHPRPELDKGAVRAVQRFLQAMGVGR
jgi:hypothetical protein